MRKLIFTSLITAMAISGSATAAGVAAQPAPSSPAVSGYDKAPWWMKDSVITQTGLVYAEVPANRASFNATFLSVDDSSDKAQAKAIEQTRALNQALARLGKDAVRVTTSFSMRALYEQYKDKDGNKVENQRGDKINGYQVSLNLSLEVRDMSVLEKAYALVMAAAPTNTGNIYFSLQPTNEQNTWMYTEAVKDARVRDALNYALDFEDLNKNLAYGGLKRVDSFFWGTELASSGLPQGRELEILNGLKDKVPPEVFTTPYANPVNGDPQKVRDNLKKAIGLFKAAGYEIKGNRMVNTKTGQPMAFEILLSSPSLVRSVQPFVNSLAKIGVTATLRTVDTSQYINRIRSFDYDMIWYVWGESMNPGNEQRNYWGSESANQPGSQNYAGIADPAVDQLIDMITSARDREEQVAAVHALDRVLLANHFVVPLFYSGEEKIVYWKKLTHPKDLPTYSTGFPAIWWSSEAAKQ